MNVIRVDVVRLGLLHHERAAMAPRESLAWHHTLHTAPQYHSPHHSTTAHPPAWHHRPHTPYMVFSSLRGHREAAQGGSQGGSQGGCTGRLTAPIRGHILSTRTMRATCGMIGNDVGHLAGRGQRAEDRGQRTEDRGQRTEGRGQRAEARGQS